MLILYIFLFITALLFYILYVGSFSFYLFSFLFIIPIILFIMNKYLAGKIKVTFLETQKTAGRLKKIPVIIKIKNPSKIPAANVIIEIEYFNVLDQKRNTVKINTPVFPNDTQYLTMHISAKHCGIIKMRIKRCRIADMLKLFKFKIKYSETERIFKECTFTIVPDYIHIENSIAQYSDFGLETDEYSKYRKGDDPSEIFDVHEYSDGDKINRIHWKLSMKQDKTMVKDYSLPISNSIVMILNLNINTNVKNYMSLYDALIESAASISSHLTENETPHRVIWYDSRKNDLITMNISSEEEHRTLIGMLLRTPLYEEKDLSMIDYINQKQRLKCGHLMYFSSSYNENLSSVMHDSDLAFRYSYMLITDQNTEIKLNDEFADIIPVVNRNIAQSIQDLCF